MARKRKNGAIPTGRETLRAPLLPPPALAAASLIVPGLGQILGRTVQKGLLLLGSLAAIGGMLAWRVSILGHLEPTPLAMLAKAFQRRPGFMGIVVACVAIVWLWNAYDAYRQGARRRRGGPGIFVLVLVAFFALGWQISEIDLGRMITQFPDAARPFSQVIWPWKAAVTSEPIEIKAQAEIQVPSTTSPPAPPVEEPGKPYVKAEPSSGQLSYVNQDNEIVPGTKVTLTGRNFRPDTETQIWWVDPLMNTFRIRAGGKYLAVTTDSQGSFQVEFNMPYRVVPESTKGSETHLVQARQEIGRGPVHASEPLLLSIERMVETIFMGMMATLFGIILSIPVSFLAARNIMSGSWVTRGIYYLTRTILNIIRAIEPLIWAIIAVVWVGLGPFAGIIALTVHSVAALGKLYSEAIEGIDSGPIEAVQATGASRLQTIMFAVVPQMIAPFVSFSIYRWDINVRMSTVIGLVGGGGIGFILVQYIRLLDYRAAGIAVWFIAITVAVLDYVSAEIRARFV
jgi:phosphonate transport system permease protein